MTGHLSLKSGALVEDGEIRFEDGGIRLKDAEGRSEALTVDLAEKTLEAWVRVSKENHQFHFFKVEDTDSPLPRGRYDAIYYHHKSSTWRNLSEFKNRTVEPVKPKETNTGTPIHHRHRLRSSGRDPNLPRGAALLGPGSQERGPRGRASILSQGPDQDRLRRGPNGDGGRGPALRSALDLGGDRRLLPGRHPAGHSRGVGTPSPAHKSASPEMNCWKRWLVRNGCWKMLPRFPWSMPSGLIGPVQG